MATMIGATSLLFSLVAFGGHREVLVAQAKIVDCAEAAEEILANNGGRLLSIRPHDDRCTIVVLVTKEGERPRKVIFRVPEAPPETK
ncbi:hypothetical protein ABID08_005962 [Rhizobium binae]|uniref:Uncharacterized protein n=1 Tax=Rhizobium binae TaxID=1138190 RepID=A0ABV2MQ42_9HYPH|nr:hypothetical protein [Rhizobium binae]MBX4970023.1 hypothetical protein [Rhizobium binae]MBX4994906.1 hypothetical protein [Rhizobium binae]NKL51671.1 hypothetical protein [Rhizobium leguminosarum bv. viciae]QSY84995.1 hypothetical protein J2J99_25780 [Rhizobium binae]